MHARLIVPVLLICLAVPLAMGGDFWLKKPYQHGSPEETRRMLEESPWAETITLSTAINNMPVLQQGGTETGPRTEMTTDPTITYTLQFRSAEPIREAQVRSSQLSSHYDSMSPDQKAAFDASAGKFLGVTFSDRVGVSVTFHTNVLNYESLLRNYWSSQSLAKLSMTAYLNAGKERLSLLNYTFKEDTFQFTFPRPKQLRPEEELSVEFVHPRTALIGEQRIRQEFNLKKMLANGEPVF